MEGTLIIRRHNVNFMLIYSILYVFYPSIVTYMHMFNIYDTNNNRILIWDIVSGQVLRDLSRGEVLYLLG